MAKEKILLTSKESIKSYITDISNGDPCSDYLFKKYIEKGLPARFDDNRWLAYSENIDEFFKLYTRVSMKNVLNQIDENAS
jgi:hypothetical protein